MRPRKVGSWKACSCLYVIFSLPTSSGQQQYTVLNMAYSADVLRISILGDQSIHVGFHLLPYIFNTILSTLPSSTYALVTDTNLSQLYLPDIKQAFDKAAKDFASKARFLVYEVAPGEGAKSRKVKAEIEDWLLDQKCTRDTVVLAFGGGVIGDLTGFVAATLWVTSSEVMTETDMRSTVCGASNSFRSPRLCWLWSTRQ